LVPLLSYSYVDNNVDNNNNNNVDDNSSKIKKISIGRVSSGMACKEKETTSTETVLILQGGGSLGAYECGVWKTLARHNIKFEIIAGTSIGATKVLELDTEFNYIVSFPVLSY
jgi:hypothetical protein